jgi:hypothetical protein
MCGGVHALEVYSELPGQLQRGAHEIEEHPDRVVPAPGQRGQRENKRERERERERGVACEAFTHHLSGTPL